ncbi:MAG: ABC transporter ATP-binding protein [Saccharofermentanales bacterium]|jgi:putative ABC transport system ATP-binding protein
MSETNRILQVEGLWKKYGDKNNLTEALRGISFDVLEGEFLGIMGASGSGKTTLLNCIASLIRPSEGRIRLAGKDISGFNDSQLAEYRGRDIGYIFQEFELLDNLTAGENITLPLNLQGLSEKKAAEPLKIIAELFGISAELNKFPAQLSGGEKQRAAAARALITNPHIVLADEPTGALDSKNAKVLMTQLAAVNQQQRRTIIMVTHDANVACYCNRILFIQDGQIYHELRRHLPAETNDSFYERIITVIAQLGGGRAHVL